MRHHVEIECIGRANPDGWVSAPFYTIATAHFASRQPGARELRHMSRAGLRLEPVATSAGGLLASLPTEGQMSDEKLVSCAQLRHLCCPLGAPCSSCRCAPSGASSSGELPGCASKSANPSRLQPSGSTEGEGAAPGGKSSSSSSSTFFAAEGRVSSSRVLRSHRGESNSGPTVYETCANGFAAEQCVHLRTVEIDRLGDRNPSPGAAGPNRPARNFRAREGRTMKVNHRSPAASSER